MKDFVKFFKFFKKYELSAILSPLCVTGEVCMEICIPYFTAQIINNGIINHYGIKYIIEIGIIMIIFSFFALLFGILGSYYCSIAANGFSTELKKEIFYKVQEFSFKNIEKYTTASLLTRSTMDIYRIKIAMMMIIRGAFRSPLMIIGSSIMAFISCPQMSIIFILSSIILVLSFYFVFKNAHHKFEKLLKLNDDLNLCIQENVIGIKVIKSFVREKYEKIKFDNKIDEITDAGIIAGKTVILQTPIINIVCYLCIIFTIYVGGKLVINKTIEVGTLTSFLTYVFQIINSLMMLSGIFLTINFSQASRQRISEVLKESPSIKDSDIDSVFKDNSLEFKNVYFSYNNSKDNLILKNINLKVNSGEILGIIGSTGSGKSTLVQLLPRLYDIDSGEIIIGNNNIKNYKLHTLRDNIAIVLQKNLLFSGTIKENILWGNENATDEEIINVCKLSQAHDFITSFDKGYDTYIEQAGENLSGGQKQRLCIARAIIKKPKILIFDDSTSAVDTATESKIRTIFKTYLKDTTKIIIAQRILSVKDADKIIVLDNGKIDAIGNHDDLLKNNTIYQEIYYSQQNGVLE